MKQTIAEILKPFLTTERFERIRSVLSKRTRDVVLVANQIDKPHNYMALLRTAEAMGIQDVHIVLMPDQTPAFVSDAVTQGADKWLTLHYYRSWTECRNRLHDGGYRIYGAYLGEKTVEMDRLSWNGKIAIVMGSELEGIDPAEAEQCDGLFCLPMFGFTQSFNVSVAASLSLQRCFLFRKQLGEKRGLLPEEESALLDEWMQKAVKNSARILEQARQAERVKTGS